MKCSRLFSSLLVSVVFLAAGSASAFSQTPAQDLPDLDMLPDSVRISIVEERPDAGWKPYGIRFYSMEDWMRHEGDIAHFNVDCGTIVIGEKSEVAALMQKLQEKDALQTEDFLEKLGIGKGICNLPDNSFCSLYDGQYKDKLTWNPLQQNLLAQAMRNPEVRRSHVERQLSRYRCVVELFLSGRKSGEMELGGRDFFVRGVWQLVPEVQHVDGMDLMRLVVNDYVDSHPQDFHNLGWQDHPEHFAALAGDFVVEEKFLLLDNSNIARGGKYTDNLGREYAAVLKLREPFGKTGRVAYPNVRIVYSASGPDNMLPRVGNLHKRGRKVVERVLEVRYFLERVEKKGERLAVWFFNDRNVNDYLISLVAERAAESGIGEKGLQRSILVEFPSDKPDMYLLLPDNRIMLLIDKGFRYNYGAFHKKMSVADPDSIEIHMQTVGFPDISNIQKGGFRGAWVDLFPESYSKQPYVLYSPDGIYQVHSAISYADMDHVDLKEFGINPRKVRREAEKIWETAANYNKWDKYCSRFSMNRMQRKFFRKSFSDPSNLERYMLQVLKGGPWYGYNAANTFMAVVHWGGGKKDTLLSGKDFFAHSLYPFVKDVWKEAAETHTPQGDALFWRLQNLWLLEHNGELHKLGMYDIGAQIKELEKDFEVAEAGQLMDFGSGGGVFVKNDAPEYYALLRTEDMPDYMEFKYIFEKRDGKFPEFDNLRGDFSGMVETVKGMPFFQKLLKEGYYKITIHYMNDSMMSEYQIGRCSGGCFEGTFEKFPSLKHPFYSGKCIYVEAIREAPYSADELPIAYNTPRLMIHGFIVAPPDRILVPYYMTRAYYPVSCKLDDRSTWAVNSKGWIGWTEKEVSNNNLMDIEGNFLY